MTIEIREMVIRAKIDQGQNQINENRMENPVDLGKVTIDTIDQNLLEYIIENCVHQVFRELERERER